MDRLGTANDEPSPSAEVVAQLLAKLAEHDAKLSKHKAKSEAELAERDAKLAERDAKLAERDAKLAERDAKLAERDAKLAEVTSERDRLQRDYEALKQELLLVKRRLFIAKAERVDTSQLELEFAQLSEKLDALAGEIPPADDDSPSKKRKPRPKGRRNLADADLPEVQVKVPDELFEKLVAEGKAERIGTETSYRLGYQRGGYRRIALVRIKYRAIDARGEANIETAPLPAELLQRTMAAPSTLAHIATQKFCDGLPLYRLESISARDGAHLDRSTMSRWLEELGATLGATVVAAMIEDARKNAFCIATDATGFAIQPGPREGPTRPRRPCRKGHYFVQIADRDHIWFEYTPKHTTEVVRVLFKGFSGYGQADAASVYDALFRPSDEDPKGDGCTRTEVACWSHVRRKFWEAALSKESLATEALVHIQKLFEVDAQLKGKRRPPSKVKELRDRHLRPLAEEFLAFAEQHFQQLAEQRGPLTSAFGYVVRQADALRAFLDDGRLRMDNNLSEGELRKVVRIRDASLFAGSDEHAQAAAQLLSLIASARLHNLDPELYLRDIIRILPYWPRDRFLELSPKHWADTRQTIDLDQLNAELGFIAVPKTDATHPTQKPPS